jgi:hypothetical protein
MLSHFIPRGYMTTAIRAATLVLTLSAASALAAPRAAAQEPPPPAIEREPPAPVTAPNAYYVELGGNGLLYSVNVDRRILPAMGVRVGVGVVPLLLGLSVDDRASLITIPVMAYFLTGPGRSHMELGAGATFTSAEFKWDTFGDADESASAFIPTGTIGYRYQAPDGGRVFRATLTPVYLFDEVIPWVGLSYGRTF